MKNFLFCTIGLFLIVCSVFLIRLFIYPNYEIAATQDGAYLYDSKTGNVLNYLKEGEIRKTRSVASENPVYSDSTSISNYGLDVSVEAKFTDDQVLIKMDASPNNSANENLLSELRTSSGYVIVEYLDRDDFLIGKSSEIRFSNATRILDINGDPVSLHASAIEGCDASIKDLVYRIDIIWSIPNSVTPIIK